MNYLKIYNNLIEKAKNRVILNGYKEKHHIIPKYINGDNSQSNLINLTAKEHYIAHHLLIKIYPENSSLFFAFNAMVGWKSNNTIKRYKPKLSAKEYEFLKIKRSKLISEKMKGRKLSEETKEKLRKINLGKTISDEVKKKLSFSNKKIKHTEEWNKKISKKLKNYKKSEEHCKKISETKKNQHIRYSEERKALCASKNGNNPSAKKCIYNGKEYECIKLALIDYANENNITYCAAKHKYVRNKLNNILVLI